jgi:ACT domain-containing protein
VEDHYDDKLGFESKVGSMQEELNNLDQKKNKLLTEINAIPQLALALGKLLSVDDNSSSEKIKLVADQIRKVGSISEATDGKSRISC